MLPKCKKENHNASYTIVRRMKLIYEKIESFNGVVPDFLNKGEEKCDFYKALTKYDK